MTTPITDHSYRPDRQGQWFTGRCDKCGEPRSAHTPACTCGEAWRGHPNPHALTCSRHLRCDDCGNYWDTPGHFHGCPKAADDLTAELQETETETPLTGLWSKRNTPSGAFEKVKRSGDVFKGVRREN